MTRILSIDPAASMSDDKPTVAVIWHNHEPLSWRAWPHPDGWERWWGAEIGDGIAVLDAVVIEASAGMPASKTGSVNVRTCEALSRVRGVYEGMARALGVEVVRMTPQTWRKRLGTSRKAHDAALCKRLSMDTGRAALAGMAADANQWPRSAGRAIGKAEDRRVALLLGLAYHRGLR